jgi:hypothetical protein
VSYANWCEGEPNNQGGGEDCVMLSRKRFWHDVSCGRKFSGYVCQRPAALTTERTH